MAEVDVRPGINEQPHTVAATPPKKRTLDEVDHSIRPSDIVSVDKDRDDADLATTGFPSGSTLVPATSPSPQMPPHKPSTAPDCIAPSTTTMTINTPNSTNCPPVSETNPPKPSTPNSKAPNPNKKRKLSPASKEARERQKLEEKIKKEEERKIREEEKKKRDEEREEEKKKREEKRKQKEEEKLAREDEKRKKEEEKMKKERSQMKLNAFFTKPAKISSKPKESEAGEKGSVAKAGSEGELNAPKPRSHYELEFPGFFLQSHVKLGPAHRFERDPDALMHACQKLDNSLRENIAESDLDTPRAFKPSELFHMIPHKRRQGKLNVPPIKEILMSMQDPQYNNIDLPDAKQAADITRRAENMLKQIPMKILRFKEDVRPPYQGTFTRRVPDHAARKMSRNPFTQGIPDWNYDYDSEAEWEEPEEGEDINSEGEDEISEDGEDDMDDFLDDGDEGATSGKRRTIVGDLEPVCSGIRWAEENPDDTLFKQFKMEVISDTLTFPIDPFSDSYWKPPVTAAKKNKSPFKIPSRAINKSSATNGTQAQGPQNQSTSSNGSSLEPSTTYTHTYSTSATAHMKMDSARINPVSLTGVMTSQKPRTKFPPDQVAEFKEVVAGSNLTKAGLVEVLKKRFPKVSKDMIKDTLTATAIRHGVKEADKKWVLI